MKRLQKKYRDRDVEFLTVYVREAHPGEGAYREFSQPQDFDQRLVYARRLVAKEDFPCPVLVDEMGEAVHRQYGSLPNVVYVIDKTGKSAYKTTWTLGEELDQILAEFTGDEPAPA